MPKKFDVVIGNPPYQEEAQGEATNQMPIYHLFMDAAHAMGHKSILITPARFLFNAGYTPKEFNKRMLADPYLQVPVYVPNSNSLFPETDIKAGVAVTYRDDSKKGKPIGTFSKFSQLGSIQAKVENLAEPTLDTLGISNDRVYRYTQTMHDEHPELWNLMSKSNEFKLDSRAFTRLANVYSDEAPGNAELFTCVLGLDQKKKRSFRWIPRSYISGPDALTKYKVALPKANGSGQFGEVLAPPLILKPWTAVTGTFITIGAFDTDDQAEACLRYLKTKFARTMLGILKVTQDNLARVWKHVPAQDFSANSAIDWTKPIPEIDQQLYSKYGLDAEEIAFIEDHVKPME